MSYAKSLLDSTRTGAHVSSSQGDCERSAGQLRPLGLGATCPVVWDGLLCWPATLGGATIQQPCPHVHNFNTQQYAFRHCLLNGTWFGATGPHESSGWSNYSLCLLSSHTARAILTTGSNVTSAGYDAALGGQHLFQGHSATAGVGTTEAVTVTQMVTENSSDVILPLDDIIGSGAHALSALCLILALVTWVTLRLTDRLLTRRYLVLIATILSSFFFHVIVMTSRLQAVSVALYTLTTPHPVPSPLLKPPSSPSPLLQPPSFPTPLGPQSSSLLPLPLFSSPPSSEQLPPSGESIEEMWVALQSLRRAARHLHAGETSTIFARDARRRAIQRRSIQRLLEEEGKNRVDWLAVAEGRVALTMEFPDLVRPRRATSNSNADRSRDLSNSPASNRKESSSPLAVKSKVHSNSEGLQRNAPASSLSHQRKEPFTSSFGQQRKVSSNNLAHEKAPPISIAYERKTHTNSLVHQKIELSSSLAHDRHSSTNFVAGQKREPLVSLAPKGKAPPDSPGSERKAFSYTVVSERRETPSKFKDSPKDPHAFPDGKDGSQRDKQDRLKDNLLKDIFVKDISNPLQDISDNDIFVQDISFLLPGIDVKDADVPAIRHRRQLQYAGFPGAQQTDEGEGDGKQRKKSDLGVPPTSKDGPMMTVCQVGRAFYLLMDLSVHAFLFSLCLYYTLVVLGKDLTFTKLLTLFLLGLGLPVISLTFSILLYIFLPSRTEFGSSCRVDELGDEFHWATTAPKLCCLVLALCLMSVSTYGFWRLHVPALHSSSETFFTRQGVLKTLALLLLLSAAELFHLVTQYQRLYGGLASWHVVLASTAVSGSKGVILALLLCFLDSEVMHVACCASSRDGEPWLRSAPRGPPGREDGCRQGNIPATRLVVASAANHYTQGCQALGDKV